jgi:hypothetical protein
VIAEHLHEKKTVQALCEENFDLWEYELFPILKAQNKSCYGAVADILKKVGYENINSAHVSTCFGRIRKKRGLK